MGDHLRAVHLHSLPLPVSQPENLPVNPNAAHTGAYHDVCREVQKFGFDRQQGSVYFGDEHVTPVTCVMAVQAVNRVHPWFSKVVSDIRMLRVEEHNDLMPAIAARTATADTGSCVGA